MVNPSGFSLVKLITSEVFLHLPCLNQKSHFPRRHKRGFFFEKAKYFFESKLDAMKWMLTYLFIYSFVMISAAIFELWRRYRNEAAEMSALLGS